MHNARVGEQIHNEISGWPIALEYWHSEDGHHFTLFHNFEDGLPAARTLQFYLRLNKPICFIGVGIGDKEAVAPFAHVRAPKLSKSADPLIPKELFHLRLVDSNSGRVVGEATGEFSFDDTQHIAKTLDAQRIAEQEHTPGQIVAFMMEEEAPALSASTYSVIRPLNVALSSVPHGSISDTH